MSKTGTGTDPLVGDVLDGRYEVLQRLARGGMATVYRAWDRRLERIVAVKVMHEGLGDDADFVAKFDREARAAARLCDKSVVGIFDQGHDHGRPYIVMEFVEGSTLRTVITRDAPLSPLRALQLIEPVAAALAVAHDSGLVHRDVKPENVLISDEGDVKIADFGLVRAVAAAGITSAGVILGTAAYLSPEQVRDGPPNQADPRSDVYSTGILTYELLTGRTPFTGDSALSIAYQRLHNDVPPPSAAIDGVPLQFDELVLRATARNPAKRYADAIEMAADLEAIVDELGLPAFRVPAPSDSAQHRSAGLGRSRMAAGRGPAPVGQPTRQLTRGPGDWSAAQPAAEPDEYEYEPGSGEFAGIAMSDFVWARQRGRRAVLIWMAVVLALTGLVATVGWTIGSNLSVLL